MRMLLESGSSKYISNCSDDSLAECDISVSKLLGFETFPFFWWYRIRFRKFLVSKKVSDSVSFFFGIEKSIGFGFKIFWYQKKYRIRFWFFLVSKKYRIRFRNFLVSKKGSDEVSKTYLSCAGFVNWLNCVSLHESHWVALLGRNTSRPQEKYG